MNVVATLEQPPNFVNHPLLEELVKQFRLQDLEGHYQNYSHESLLSLLIHPSKLSAIRRKSRQNFNQLRIRAFYQTIASEIEKKTGRVPETVIHLNPSGSSSALILCGNLLVVYDLLEQVGAGLPRPYPESLDKLILTVEHTIQQAVYRIQQFF